MVPKEMPPRIKGPKAQPCSMLGTPGAATAFHPLSPQLCQQQRCLIHPSLLVEQIHPGHRQESESAVIPQAPSLSEQGNTAFKSASLPDVAKQSSLTRLASIFDVVIAGPGSGTDTETTEESLQCKELPLSPSSQSPSATGRRTLHINTSGELSLLK